MESDIYKINNSNRHSGIYYGPLCGVYGIGVIVLILIKKYFLLNKLYLRLKYNKLYYL